MHARQAQRTSAFTLIEVIVICVALVMFLVLILVGVQHSKREAQRRLCAANLRTLGIAMRGFGIEPWPDSYMMALARLTSTSDQLGEARRYFITFTNELETPNILLCPADSTRSPAKNFQVLANTNLSYFVGVDSGDVIPKSIMAGDDNITLGGTISPAGLLQIPINTPVGWTSHRHRHQGHLLFGDGSVQCVISRRLTAILNATTFATNRLAMP